MQLAAMIMLPAMGYVVRVGHEALKSLLAERRQDQKAGIAPWGGDLDAHTTAWDHNVVAAQPIKPHTGEQPVVVAATVVAAEPGRHRPERILRVVPDLTRELPFVPTPYPGVQVTRRTRLPERRLRMLQEEVV